MRLRDYIISLLTVAVSLSIGCATTERPSVSPGTAKPFEATAAVSGDTAQGIAAGDKASAEGAGESSPGTVAELFPGNGQFIDTAAAGRRAYAVTRDGDVTLNFQASDIQEVVKSILGDILKFNYTIDDKVKGQVYLQTSAPLARDALIPMLEAVLRMKGAVLINSGDLYKIVPEADALSSAVSPDVRVFRDRGFQLLVVPLRYIAVSEMRKILEPLKPSNGSIQSDEQRNLLLLAGTQTELAHLMKTVKIFDVNQLKGMSVGLFRLGASDPKTMIKELHEVMGNGDQAALSGMLRFAAVERLNALLVITPQQEYLEQAKLWIERLDQVGDATAVSLHVYRVQNSRAVHMADLLTQLFTGQRRRADTAPAERLAPGMVPAVIQSPVKTDSIPTRDGAPTPVAAARPGSPLVAAMARRVDAEAASTSARPRALGEGDLEVGEVNIIADDTNNALLVKASTPDYAKIEKAIKKLDVLPLQVLVETTIVDVELTGDFSFGLEWFFKSKLDSKRGRGLLDLGASGIGPLTPGFSYTIVDSADLVRGALNTLASEGKTNILSSPSLMVLDNRTASIRVGDQVPIRTSEGSSIATSGEQPIIASTIEMRDTGVLLEVTPRVNASGVITMEIVQEVNDPEQTTTSGIDSPTINQRRIQTTVAVQSGESIVLGGLIRDRRARGKTGVPGLRNIPVLGWLFGSRNKSAQRSELVVLITPTAVRDQSEARAVTEEFRDKMKSVFQYHDAVKGGQVPTMLEERKGKIRP